MNIHHLSYQPGRTAIVDGKECLFFSGYSYLGMSHVPAFNELVKEGFDKYGLLFPSSRISNTRLSLFEEAEALLSVLTGSEETVLASSGFTAGQMSVLVYNQKIHCLPYAHPAIQSGNTNEGDKHIIATDSINVLNATVTDFSFLQQSPADICIVDDSHGFGLLGERGGGIAFSLPKLNVEYVLTYSLSKACNIIGGAISCTKQTANKLRALPSYAAGTAASPAYLYAFIKGQSLYALQREKLKKNIAFFQSLIKNIEGVKYNPQLPVFILPGTVDEEKLFADNIIISSFAYPDPNGKKIQRIVLNALHTEEDMERLINCLLRYNK